MRIVKTFWLGGIALALGLAAHIAWAVVPITRVGDAAYSITATNTNIQTTTAFTAARTWTLPFAAATCIGQSCQPAANQLQILDTAGAITATNTLTIAPQSGDTINGNAANLILSAAGVRVILIPTSANNWNATVYGDYRSTSVLSASAVALTTKTGKTIGSISLSQGLWNCNGALTRKLAATTSVTQLKTSISTTTDTSGTLDAGTAVQWSTAANVMAADTTQVIGPVTLTPIATTSYYLVAEDTFTVDTNAGYGQLNCRRVK